MTSILYTDIISRRETPNKALLTSFMRVYDDIYSQTYRVFYDREDSSILWLCMSSDDSETLIRQYNSQRRREASDFYIYIYIYRGYDIRNR